MSKISADYRKIGIVTFLFLFFVGLPPVAMIMGQEYWLILFSRILIYGLAAVSLDLILGFGGMVSLGHAAFMGIGGYAVGIFAFHSYEGTPLFSFLPLAGSENGLVVWPAAIAVAIVFGAITGAISLRTKGMHFIMITLAFAQMLFYFFTSLEIYGGSDGIVLYSRNFLPGLDLVSPVQFYYLCLFLLSVSLLLAHRLILSGFGRALMGCRENELRLQVLGLAGHRYKLLFYILSGAIGCLAGILLANQGEFVSPGLLHWTKSGEVLIMVILGGMGTLIGPVIGAAVFLLMEEYLSMYTEHWMVILGPLLILIVLFARNGIYGLLTYRRGQND